ncbi:MAG: hypothetical protein AAFQ21_09625 [Pseudomonadota bacterium]
MCLPISDETMIEWLRRQVMMVEAWREQLAERAELDIDDIRRVEDHYQWLCAEVSRLESGRKTRAA